MLLTKNSYVLLESLATKTMEGTINKGEISLEFNKFLYSLSCAPINVPLMIASEQVDTLEGLLSECPFEVISIGTVLMRVDESDYPELRDKLESDEVLIYADTVYGIVRNTFRKAEVSKAHKFFFKLKKKEFVRVAAIKDILYNEEQLSFKSPELVLKHALDI